MKTRHGFVSNSSTTSFSIYGISMDDADINVDLFVRIKQNMPKAFEGIVKQANTYYSDFVEYFNNIDSLTKEQKSELQELIDDLGPEMIEMLDCLSFEVHWTPWDVTYVGTSWNSIGEDETPRQFKARVEKEMKKFFGDNIKCESYEEAFRDG